MSEEFKWNNRRKATETAVKYKHEKGITAQEAVERVLKEFEGKYHVNSSQISETRFNNFVKRVEEDKSYKSSKSAPTNVELKQTKIAELLDKGELTDLQAVVLDSIFNLLAGYEVGYSEIQISDVAEDCDIKPERVKGAIGHLIKKGYVSTREVEKGEDKITCIYIADDKYGLYNDDVLEYKKGYEKAKAEAEELSEDEVETVGQEAEPVEQ